MAPLSLLSLSLFISSLSSLGYWIAHRGIKLVYDVEDGFRQVPPGTDIKRLKDTVYSYFNVRMNTAYSVKDSNC